MREEDDGVEEDEMEDMAADCAVAKVVVAWLDVDGVAIHDNLSTATKLDAVVGVLDAGNATP